MALEIKPSSASSNNGLNAAVRADSDKLIEEAQRLGAKAKKAWLPTTQIDLGREAFAAVKKAASTDPSNPAAWRLYAESLSEMGLATFAGAAISQVGGGETEFRKSVQTVLSKLNGPEFGTDRDIQLKKDLLKILK